MTYHTSIVYIFSVLEVNIAILVASIPIFWPMINSFATNKILVVNEIVVHVEQYPKTSLDGEPGIGLADQAAFKSPPASPGATPPPHPSYLSNIAHKFDRRPSRDAHPPLTKHRSKGSVASSIGQSLPRSEVHIRASQESQRNLFRMTMLATPAIGKVCGTTPPPQAVEPDEARMKEKSRPRRIDGMSATQFGRMRERIAIYLIASDKPNDLSAEEKAAVDARRADFAPFVKAWKDGSLEWSYWGDVFSAWK